MRTLLSSDLLCLARLRCVFAQRREHGREARVRRKRRASRSDRAAGRCRQRQVQRSILQALADGELVDRGQTRSDRQGRGATDAVTGAKLPAVARRQGRHHRQQPPAARARRGARRAEARLAGARRAPCRRERARAAAPSGDAAAGEEGAREGDRCRDQADARADRGDAGAASRGSQRAARRGADAGELEQREHQERCCSSLLESREGRRSCAPKRREACARSKAARMGRARRPRVHRRQARLDPAARRARPRDHLRTDGRHQHGARRADHDRRLRDLRRAETVSQHVPAVRLVPARRDAGRVRCRRRWSAWRSSAR